MTIVTEEEADLLMASSPEDWPRLAIAFQAKHPDWIRVEKNGNLIGFATNEEDAQKMRDGWQE